MLVDDISYEYFSMEIEDDFKWDIVRDAGGYCCSEEFCFLTGMFVVATKDTVHGEIKSSRMLTLGCLFCGVELDMKTGEWVKKDPAPPV